MLLDPTINADPNGLKKEHCIFVQFQNMFRFKEMFICTYGTEAEKSITHLKTLLNAAFVKMAGDSEVFFERPLLSEGAKTRFLLFNKKDNTIEFNGEARFEKEFLVKDENSPTPQQIINYGEIDDCKFEYKDVSFPNATNFSQIP